MRTWWAYICVGVLTCSVAYQHFNQPSLPTGSVGSSEQSEWHPLAQRPELPLTYKDDGRLDEGRVQDVDSAPAALKPDQLPNAQKEARLEDTTGTVTIEHSDRNDTKQNLSYLAYYAYSEVSPETKPAVAVLDSL